MALPEFTPDHEPAGAADHAADDRFGALLLQLYRDAQALPLADFQDAALERLKSVLPFDSSLWGTADARPEGADIRTVHLHRQAPRMLEDYEAVKHLDSAVGTMFAQRRATRGFSLEHWFTQPGEAPIRDMLRRFGIENMLATVSNDPATRFTHWLLLYRSDPGARYTPREERRLALLAPHVMEALAINRKLHLERLHPEAPGQRARGQAIADLRGRVYHADARFDALARLEWPEWPRQQPGQLPAALAAHAVAGHERFRGERIVVDARLDQQLLFLGARERCAADGLTAREFTIARLIAEGDTHKEIARKLERSPATVRNQIQGIYEKLGVGSIAGLIEALRRAD